MVQVIQPRDIGGEIGQSFGGGFGSAMEMLGKRSMLQQGIGNVQKQMETARASGERINPLDVTLSLMSQMGGVPGGMQALGELAPAIHKEVNRLNLLQDSNPAAKSKVMPSRSINEGGETVVDTREADVVDPKDYYQSVYQEKLRQTNDPDLATQQANADITARTAEQQRRQNEHTASTNFLSQKLDENFKEGLNPALNNELSKEYFDRTKTTDPSQAWNELFPKYRKAQVSIESLQNATASNRPLLFTGDMDKRMENARVALKDVANIDPEYAMGLAMKELDYGPAEAAEIIRPGDSKFKQFTSKVKDMTLDIPLSQTGLPLVPEKLKIPYTKEIKKTQNQLDQYLKTGFNPEKDSLLALRAKMFDKGFPEDKFMESVNKAFPGANEDPKLSGFNQNEYTKLSEAIIPGLQEIFSVILSGKFMPAVRKRFEAEKRGKR